MVEGEFVRIDPKSPGGPPKNPPLEVDVRLLVMVKATPDFAYSAQKLGKTNAHGFALKFEKEFGEALNKKVAQWEENLRIHITQRLKKALEEPVVTEDKRFKEGTKVAQVEIDFEDSLPRLEVEIG